METLADHKSMPPGGQKQSLARDISRYRVPVSRTSLQCPPDHSPYFLLYTTEQLQHRDPSCTEVVSRRKPASRQEERILQLRSNIERLTYRLHEAGDDLKKAATALKRKIRQADNHAQMLEHTSDYLQKVSTANREGASLIVFNALRLMQQYPGKQIDEICQELRVSGRQFRRVFGEKAGMSPKYFLQIVRLHKAAALAQSTSDTDFQQIIHECGYYDQSHFARDIKRFTGKSPKQFFQHEA